MDGHWCKSGRLDLIVPARLLCFNGVAHETVRVSDARSAPSFFPRPARPVPPSAAFATDDGGGAAALPIGDEVL